MEQREGEKRSEEERGGRKNPKTYDNQVFFPFSQECFTL